MRGGGLPWKPVVMVPFQGPGGFLLAGLKHTRSWLGLLSSFLGQPFVEFKGFGMVTLPSPGHQITRDIPVTSPALEA